MGNTVVGVSYTCDACHKDFKDGESYNRHVGMNCIEIFELSLNSKQRAQFVYPESYMADISLDRLLIKAEKCVEDDDDGNLKRDWYFGEKAKRKRRKIVGVSRNELFSSIFMKSEYDNVNRMAVGVKDYNSDDTAFVFFKDISEISDAVARMADGLKEYAEKFTGKKLEKGVWNPYRKIEDLMGNRISGMLQPVLDDLDGIKEIMDGEPDESSFSMEASFDNQVCFEFSSTNAHYVDFDALKNEPFSKWYYKCKERQRQERVARERKEEEERRKREEEERKKKEEAKKKPPYLDTDWFIARIRINSCDETDFEGFEVVNGAERKEFERLCQKGFDGMDIHWGTNSDDEYDCSDFKKAVYEYKKISKQDMSTLNRLGLMSGGNISYSCFIGLMQRKEEEEKEEYEEEDVQS